MQYSFQGLGSCFLSTYASLLSFFPALKQKGAQQKRRQKETKAPKNRPSVSYYPNSLITPTKGRKTTGGKQALENIQQIHIHICVYVGTRPRTVMVTTNRSTKKTPGKC